MFMYFGSYLCVIHRADQGSDNLLHLVRDYGNVGEKEELYAYQYIFSSKTIP